MTSRPSSRAGYIALLSVLIISAVAASTVLMLFVTSVSSSLNSADTFRGKIVKGLAEACAELALQRLTSGVANPCGSSFCTTYPLANGTCAIDSITNTSGTTWRIRTSGTSTVGSITKYLEVEAERPNVGTAVTMSSWKECLNFSVAPCPTPSQ